MEETLATIYDAACRLFIEKGFKAAQMGEIAKAAGIATGSMYKWFAGKTACLHFCLCQAMGQEPQETPMRERTSQELMDCMLRWASRFDKQFSGAAERMKIEEMVSQLYDAIAQSQYAILLLERCEEELGEVSREYWHQRQGLFDVLEQNLNTYIEKGEMRRLPYLHALVPSFLSITTWWALHADFDSKGVKIDKKLAKQIAMDLTMHAYREQELQNEKS